MIVIIDYMNLVKNISYSIMSGSVACCFPTEPEEIAHRYFKQIYSLKQEYKDATIIFASDSKPYWRTQFLNKWYTERGVEPVQYKGNRVNMSWPFSTSKEDMYNLYNMLLVQGAKSIGGVVVRDTGLEADDIFGLIAVTSDQEVIGYSGDSDWRQLVNGRVKIFDFVKGKLITEPIDIREKWIGGDSGDNIKGCTKFKKDGTPSKNKWGEDGAKKLLLLPEEEWRGLLDPEELERNKVVTTLPCPLWDTCESLDYLYDVAVKYEADESIFDKYYVTKNIRNLLDTKANRDIFTRNLRLFIQTKEKENEQRSLD